MKDIFEHGKYVGNQCDACGQCCNVVMFPSEWYEEFKDQTIEPVIFLKEREGVVIPFTASGKCCFQLESGKCSRQEDKSDVCKNWNCGGNHATKPLKSWLEHTFKDPAGNSWKLEYMLSRID